jgi:hypothetical protein
MPHFKVIWTIRSISQHCFGGKRGVTSVIMARPMKLPSALQMEDELGYSAHSLGLASQQAGNRFYLDLKPVPMDGLTQLRTEYVESKRARLGDPPNTASDVVASSRETLMSSSLDAITHYERGFITQTAQVIQGRDSIVFVAKTDRVGLYKISVDIVFERRFSLALLLTEAEAWLTWRHWRLITTSPASSRANRICHGTDPGLLPVEAPQTIAGQDLDRSCFSLFKLPAEIRELIYSFSIPNRDLSIRDLETFSRRAFPQALGDPAGFLFQLGREPEVLHVSRRMRREALPFAYRKTNFKLDDMDEAVRLLIAVGSIGRDNITSLQFPWMSRVEIAHRWEVCPDAGDNDTRLPCLQVPSCIGLLRSCKRLAVLRICIEKDVIEDSSETQFITDPGLTALATLGVRSFEILDSTEESLEKYRIVKRLQRKS